MQTWGFVLGAHVSRQTLLLWKKRAAACTAPACTPPMSEGGRVPTPLPSTGGPGQPEDKTTKGLWLLVPWFLWFRCDA